jgi:hypothetical protein
LLSARPYSVNGILHESAQYPNSLKKRSTKSQNAQVRLDFRYDGDTVDIDIECACARNGKGGMLPAMKALFLAFVFMSSGLLPVISDDAQLKVGSMAVARDPTGTVLGADSTQSLDKLMEFVRGQDLKAIKELMREGHIVDIKSGSTVKILSFDSRANAYKVRVFGSTKEIWLIKETVFAK